MTTENVTTTTETPSEPKRTAISRWKDILKERRRKALRFVEYKRLKRIRNHRSPQYSHCKNCGTALQGIYCHKCGQYALDINQSFLKYIEQFFENAYQFDGKIFQTLRYLFTKPGFLSKEFMAGKINSYMHPLKLFMFASIVFFSFIFALYTGDEYVNAFAALDTETVQVSQVKDSVINELKPQQTVDKKEIKQEKDTTTVKKKDKKTKNKKDKSDKDDDQKLTPKMMKLIYQDAFGQISKYLPLMILFLLPVYAFILRLLFRKTQPVYMASFVASIHIHTVLILILSILVLIHVYIGALWLFMYALYGFLIYILLAVRAFYHNNWVKTIIKTCLSLAFYIFVVLLATLALTIIIAMNIQTNYLT